MNPSPVEQHQRTRLIRHVFAAAVITAAIVISGAHTAVEAQPSKSTIDEIRQELMQLPYYGVFDFLAFNYDRGTVTLMGYAYHPGLKSDAEHAVKRAAQVDAVVNKIEDLPPSPNDDEVRWKTYYAIYRDPFLSRYAPGGAMLWGHRHPFGSGLHALGAGPFSGMEPAGDFPLHIIVKGGRITLLGVVDNEGDKTVAGMKARSVAGSFGVDNQLMVDNVRKSTSR
jgi:hyperosmotically inducible protein